MQSLHGTSRFLLLAFKLATALTAGNTFIHKPCEETPVSALRFAELLAENIDLPNDIYNVVPDYRTGAGEALTRQEGANKITFTGSTETGRVIGRNAASNVTPIPLELGGKSLNIVFPSTTLVNVVNGIIKGIFAATGQTCVAGLHVIVHDDIYDEIVDRLTERAAAVKLGDSMNADSQMGLVVFLDQWKKVKRLIEEGEAEGATVAFSDERPDGLPSKCIRYFIISPVSTTIWRSTRGKSLARSCV